MGSTQLEYAEKRMKQKWFDLVMAEQKGASVPALERMYNAYMLAVEEYNRCIVDTRPAEQTEPPPLQVPSLPVKPKKIRKKAS